MKTLHYSWKNFLVFLFFIFTTTSFAQGNTCATATELTINGACGSTTINGPIATALCGATGWQRVEYYYFTVSSGPQNITITAQSGDRNLVLGLFSGACGSLVNVSCADADNTNGAQTETITASNLANGTYYVAVGNTRNANLNLTSICVTGTTPCSGTPTAGTTTVTPTSGAAGSSYTVSNTGHATGSGITYQWQFSTNGGGSWTNQGAATSTYSNYTATAPASGTVIWRLLVTCTASGQSSTSTTATFTVTGAQNIPATGSTTVSCGTNVTLLDNGGTGDYANSSNGHTVLEAGLGATINISGNYVTESSLDFIRIYNGVGIAGTLLATYSGTGTINYTGTPGQTLTVRFSSDGSIVYSGFSLSVTYSGTCFPSCSGTPTGGTTTTSPATGNPGSSYTVSATGYTSAIGLTFQWQSSTNGGGSWTNEGASSGTYANYNATAPALGTTVTWRLVVTCTASGQSANSGTSTFTSTSSLNVPTTGSNSVTCGTNITIYDNGGPSGNYVNNSNGHTVLEAGLGATINISGTYATEGFTSDYIRIFNGSGTGGTILATYSGTGTINYTGTAGQTLTVQFYSDGSVVNTGFNLSVTYTGVCFPACTGAPTGGTVSVSPVNGGPGSNYTVSATGVTLATGMTYQWQSNTNGAGWVNVGASSSTYSNFSATAPGTVGTTIVWRLQVTCTNSSQSATSSTSTFTVVSILNIPSTGSNTVSCGTNITLYDNGGPSGDYSNNADGFTVLQAGLGGIINISGNYVTESVDDIIIYAGSGTGGTVLATYSGTGTINYTGAAGQTLTIRFDSDGSIVYSGFALSVTYSGTCFPVCTGAPTGGTISTSPNTGWPGSSYTVSATGYTQALDLLYQWQFSTDGGTTWTNAGVATSTYSNFSATAPASGLVHWRLVVTCTNSGQSANSNVGIFTTMIVSDVETGCPNVVSGGLGLNGADPAAINCTAASTCVNLEATYLDLGETTSYIVEPILYNPPFAFSGLANPISVNIDDRWSPIVNLPFDFCFYGATYDRCLVGSNGVITFDTTNNTPTTGFCDWEFDSSNPGSLPISGHSSLIENAIFGVFHDINPALGGEIGWELVTLSTGCQALVAAWNDVPMFSCTSSLYSGMMVLYENSNIIEIYIQEKNVCATWNDGNAVVGIQNASGTLASVAPGRNGLDTNWTTTNEAWRFVPNGNSIASIAWHEGSGTAGPVVGTTPIISVCPTSTTTYTAEITYTLCDGRTIVETDETVVTINGAKVWNGTVSTNWNVANNWTPVGVPTASDCVVIPDTANDPIISGTNFNALGLNLTVDNNATLTVTPDNSLTITDWVNINTIGNLVLQNSASLIQINNDANQGTMNMTRTANIRRLDYVYWSSPVANFSVNNISPGTTGFKYKWTPTISGNVNGFGNWTTANEAMVQGKGYIVRGPDNYTTALTPFNAVFTGTPNNGTITTPISRGSWNGGTYATGVSTTLGTNNDDNWNLIGNPYPSAIDAIDFLTLNTNIDGFINVWTHGTLPSTAIVDPFYNDYVYNYTVGDYITYNSSGASAGPGTFGGYVGAGQGFFVLMNHTSASDVENVTFNNTMRSSTYDNTQFFRTSDDNGRIWLDLIAANGSNVRNLVAYTDGATNNRDRLFDAITDEKLNLNLYSAIGDEFMKIQGRTLPFDEEDRVPMGIKIPQNGNYTIGIAAVDGFFTDTNQNIYLEDLENNIIHDLRQNPYSFTADAGNYPTRFVLRFTNETLGGDDLIADEANLWVFASDALSVKSTKNTIQSVRVFDVLGRQLAYYPNVDGYEVPLNTIQKNNAGLIIQVTLSNGTVISKKAIY